MPIETKLKLCVPIQIADAVVILLMFATGLREGSKINSLLDLERGEVLEILLSILDKEVLN